MSETDWGQWSEPREAGGGETDTDTKTNGQQMDPLSVDNSELSSTTINDLGEYELIKIFKYFRIKERVQISWVSRKWRDCVNKSFKSETIFDMESVGIKSMFTVKLIGPLLEKCSNVRHISLVGVSFSSFDDNFEEMDTLMTAIVSNCSHLQSINFSAIEVSDEIFKRNAKYFLSLKKITSTAIGEEALNSIIDSETLELIDINRNDKISKPEFKRLGPKIRELHLIESEVNNEIAIKDLCEANGKRLQTLSIDIKDSKVLDLICDNLKNLKELKLCLYSENCDFKRFTNLIDLKKLEVVAKDSIFKSEEFIDLIRSLKVTKISELGVYLSSMNNIAVTDESLLDVRKNCPFLEKLVIRDANSLTGSGMYSISQLKKLKHLNLKNCLNITDQIDIVITSCPLLRELILHSCLHITNGTAEAFIEKAKAFPDEEFFLDVIDTNVSYESLQSERPKKLKILYETEYCSYASCEHGWGPDGYHSGSDYNIDNMDDLDFYGDDDDDEDYYALGEDYGEEGIDFELT